MRQLLIGSMAVLAAMLGPGTETRALTEQAVGAVYTATNSPAGNAIVVLERGADGALAPAGEYPTGGLGTGAGLGNQGGLRITADGQFLVVVNAGSHDVSVLEITAEGLAWRDTALSGGTAPISVAVNGRLVYVLNAGGAAGGTDTVVGFRLSRAGHLTMLQGSTRTLSAPSTGPAQVEFSPDGRALVVTEKDTNVIDLFAVGDDGRLGSGMSYASSGQTPFGFAFGKRNQLFVSEASGGAVDASAISSYQLTRTGQLGLVSPSVPTTETAACWVVVTGDGRFLYTTNAGSGSISGYRIRPDGTIALLDASGMTAAAGPGPSDMALSGNGRILYALHAGIGAISAFGVDAHGQLTSLGLTTIPAGANGLAAR